MTKKSNIGANPTEISNSRRFETSRSVDSKILTAICLSLWSLSITCSNPAMAQKAKNTDKFYKAPHSIHGKTVLLPIGTHIEGRINETISSRGKPGQRFSIEITSPVLVNSTDVVIPSGSKIIGEVVEAIPSSKQKKPPGASKKPLGKLRTQLNMLQTPDGVTHPIVATIAAENTTMGKGRMLANREMNNPTLGYVGSASGFDAVNPHLDKKGFSMQRGPKVVGRREYFRDPILGTDPQASRGNPGAPVIRSMQQKGRDVYIYAGSPLKIRLGSPLKLGVAAAKGQLSIDHSALTPSAPSEGGDRSFRRFQPEGGTPTINNPGNITSNQQADAPAPQQVAPPPDPEDELPNFLRKSKSEKFREAFNSQPANGSSGPGNSGNTTPGDF